MLFWLLIYGVVIAELSVSSLWGMSNLPTIGTVHDYLNLTFDQKKAWKERTDSVRLCKEAQVFKDESGRQDECSSPDFSTHPALSNLNDVYQIACKLRDKYNDKERILGLGQSPAYIMALCKAMDVLENKSNHFEAQTIAFSRKAEKWEFEEEPPLTSKDEIAYRNYLTSLHLQPSQIVSRGKDKNSNTVVIDFGSTGESIRSWLGFMKKWAQETKIDSLSSYLTIGMYKDFSYYQNPEEEKKALSIIKGFDVESLSDNAHELAIMENFASQSDLIGQRLVMRYHHLSWSKKNPRQFVPALVAQGLLFRIFDYAYHKNLATETSKGLTGGLSHKPLAYPQNNTEISHI